MCSCSDFLFGPLLICLCSIFYFLNFKSTKSRFIMVICHFCVERPLYLQEQPMHWGWVIIYCFLKQWKNNKNSFSISLSLSDSYMTVCKKVSLSEMNIQSCIMRCKSFKEKGKRTAWCEMLCSVLFARW